MSNTLTELRRKNRKVESNEEEIKIGSQKPHLFEK